MNFLRKIVSGKRRRLLTEKYDLDITYVTERVCGMSFPASGFEKVYRNNINDVSFCESELFFLVYDAFRSHLFLLALIKYHYCL
jgi:hypothetical protein